MFTSYLLHYKNQPPGTSLVVQWLRILLAMQGLVESSLRGMLGGNKAQVPQRKIRVLQLEPEAAKESKFKYIYISLKSNNREVLLLTLHIGLGSVGTVSPLHSLSPGQLPGGRLGHPRLFSHIWR